MDLNSAESQSNEEVFKRISAFRLMDDELMTLVFDQNIEGIQLVLNIILERTDLIVTEVKTQSSSKNVSGHSARFDVRAKDSSGINFDVEIQREDRGASAQRARFNGSMLDATMLQPGEDYSKLHDYYVIFITENDVLNAGLSLYHINRWVEETKSPFGDGSHIIYANGAYHNEDSDIGKLMHDFRCLSPDDMHYDVLANRVRYFKETEGGQEAMSRIMEEMCNEAAAKAAAEAAAKAEHDSRVENAKAMLQDSMDYQLVAKYSGLSVEEVEALAGKRSA